MISKLVLGLFLILPSVAMAEEGMWTLDNLPIKEFKKQYGFKLTDQWVDQVKLSSVRLANGCSGSFVSPTGLVMTNHHCVRSCIHQLSSKRKDYMEKGFYAKKHRQELRCPAFEVNRLTSISDVTKPVQNATKGLKGEAYNKARKAEIAKIEKACAKSESLRCDVVTLYHGGLFHLYTYQRYPDVRLVFAPEGHIAHFGGDPDNFNFPRYSLDVSFLRVYQDGKPLDNKNYFKWSNGGAKEKELTFITGHPGRTSRLLTISQLEYQRDTALLGRLFELAELRGLLHEFGKRGKEEKRIANNKLMGVENRFKALKGRQQALSDKQFFAKLIAQEKKLRGKVKSNSKFRKKYGNAWTDIEKATNRLVEIRDDLNNIENNSFGSRLFGIARKLVRAADELPKANNERFPEYTDSKLPRFKQGLFSDAPIHPKLEKAMIEFELVKMRETLSPDHPFVRKVLGKKSPEQLAKELVSKTKLGKVKNRKKLFDGGKKAIIASKDPMIKLALLMDPDSRAIRKTFENEVESKIKKASEQIAKAKFDIEGTDTYPDATFSLRISYGQVKGFSEKGRFISPTTQVGGIFARATGSDPFALPKSWKKSRGKLKDSTKFNFVTTNDIIGGNSGSPVINKNAEIVGLVFDGNIHSLGGAYGFDETVNRAVSVHSDVILHTMNNVYGAKALVDEIAK